MEDSKKRKKSGSLEGNALLGKAQSEKCFS